MSYLVDKWKQVVVAYGFDGWFVRDDDIRSLSPDAVHAVTAGNDNDLGLWDKEYPEVSRGGNLLQVE